MTVEWDEDECTIGLLKLTVGCVTFAIDLDQQILTMVTDVWTSDPETLRQFCAGIVDYFNAVLRTDDSIETMTQVKDENARLRALIESARVSLAIGAWSDAAGALDRALHDGPATAAPPTTAEAYRRRLGQ